MCKIILTDENNNFKTLVVSGETYAKILNHLKINIQTADVYINGKRMSKEKMNKYVPSSGVVHLVVKNKTISV